MSQIYANTCRIRGFPFEIRDIFSIDLITKRRACREKRNSVCVNEIIVNNQDKNILRILF